MDPLTLAPLALSAWKIIEPFAKKLGGKLLEKAGEELPEAVAKVWDAVKNKMQANPATAETPAEVVNDPENTNVQGMFQHQLEKLLKNDEEFAEQLAGLVKQAESVTNYNATLTGDGAIAQGNNATAVGSRGVNVGGNVSGNIITGDDNVIGGDGKKKK